MLFDEAVIRNAKQVLKPHRIDFEPTKVVFSYRFEFVNRLLNVFYQWIFIPVNIVLAVFEIVLFDMQGWHQDMYLIPLIHLGLLAFPYFYYSDLPPKQVIFTNRDIVLKKGKLFKRNNREKIPKSEVLGVNYQMLQLKGVSRATIEVELRSREKKVLTRLQVDDKESAANACDVFRYFCLTKNN